MKCRIAQTKFEIDFCEFRLCPPILILISIRWKHGKKERKMKEFDRLDMKFSVSVSFHSEITLKRLLRVCVICGAAGAAVCGLSTIDLFR